MVIIQITVNTPNEYTISSLKDIILKQIPLAYPFRIIDIDGDRMTARNKSIIVSQIVNNPLPDDQTIFNFLDSTIVTLAYYSPEDPLYMKLKYSARLL